MAGLSAAAALPAGLVEALGSPAAYPDDPGAASGVQHVQTHLSHVFLTAGRVYKLRRPAVFEYVDFGSRARRNADCVRELVLNRRLAPDVYLGVAPVTRGAAGFALGAPGEALVGDAEHVVVMRRLPTGRDALSLVQSGQLTPAMLDALAERIARFHAEARLGRPAPFDAASWRARIEQPAVENFRVLREALPAELAPAVERTAARVQRVLAERAGDFERRRLEGRAVDGHGDLHLQHVWYEVPDAPCAIDCVEFRDDFRRADAAADVALLAMDLEYRGRPDLAEHFAAAYAARADDYDLYPVLGWYVGYRAAVRAKVAALAARDSELPAEQRTRAAHSARAHLHLAETALAARPRPREGALLLVGGSSVTDRGRVAAELGLRAGGVVIRAERVRAQLAGGAPSRHGAEEARSRASSGAYAPADPCRALLERADHVLDTGRRVILDAAWSSRRQRSELRRWAELRGLEPLLIEVGCPPEQARERRALEPAGAPAADGPVAEAAAGATGYEPAEEYPPQRRVHLDPSQPDWRGQVAELALRVGPAVAPDHAERGPLSRRVLH
jgi:aminoglycoside phosphotransferase family enzyme/predicted kinase